MNTRGSKKGLAATDLAAKATATLAAKVAAAQVVEGVPTTSKYRSNLVVGHCKFFKGFICRHRPGWKWETVHCFT